MTHPIYLGFQIDWPLFIKVPFGQYERGDHFDWFSKNVDPKRVAQLYAAGYVHHNKDLEKETKVGDRLEELEGAKLEKLVASLNNEVKSRSNSTSEYTAKKCKQSRIDAKQRGLLRSFLRNNRWIEERFFELRDEILG